MSRSAWLSISVVPVTIATLFLSVNGCGAPGAHPGPSYTLTATALAPDSIAPGDSAASIITVTPSNGPAKGYTGTVFLSCSSTPGGFGSPTCTFSVNPIVISTRAQVTSTLTVFTTNNTSAASYTITVSALDGTNASSSNGSQGLSITVI
jgi:hypothetical protein